VPTDDEDERQDEDHAEEDEEDEESAGEDEGEDEDDTFTCRLCGKTIDVGDGEETFALCDHCAKDYDIDKMWDDFDNEIITGSNARTVSLDKYRLRKGPQKLQRPPRNR
jgi:cobalamin biosynthesis protein CobT